MAELVPVPLSTLLRRAHHELRTTHAIFDLPVRKFYTRSRAGGGPDLSVGYAGVRAQAPIGPAAGPHTQLAQNIALAWLAGARVIELKTVQVNDRLQLTRPCIDMATIGYNTEWSQELRLEDSLREYVKASMLIELFHAADVLGVPAGPTVFDVSVGYNLSGLQSDAMRRWLDGIRHAGPIVEELRGAIPDEFAHLRDLPFRTELSNCITLSTFHGTPAEDIERIGEFLVGELGFHTIIKLNPPMLGRERVEHLLHDVLGYTDIQPSPAGFEHVLGFDAAVEMIGRLQRLAASRGVSVGIKCGNTLEVVNTGGFLKERVQYLSGQPLHALHVALVEQWRGRMGAGLQIAFSAGVDAVNAADCVAAGLVPVTTCTDLLRPGGYGRLPRYLENLEGRLRECGAATIDEFILRTSGLGDKSAAILANTKRLLNLALSDGRYRADRNRQRPRKLGTRLWLWDCLTCGKCIPACPNDAVFEIDVEPFLGEMPAILVGPDGWRELERKLYRALKPVQLATFADACNDCGNCDVFCPEDGGPNLEKPRFFGSIQSWLNAAPLPGFVVTREQDDLVIRGRFSAGGFTLRHTDGSPIGQFSAAGASVTMDWTTHQVVSAECAGPTAAVAATLNDVTGVRAVDLAHYMTLRVLLDAVSRTTRVNFVTAALAG